ncbi:MAG: HlyD family efflux transporter periplasmic adaptor subunit, partial [Nitrospinaceae bacterium]|nr:HlyD family efflux transporter periplasmic adaptor subunit [Nitrospinaceae bacterium]NIR54366.1 HlyD family efflux transporter periplasmic adaptor subunit [Nitrospinaceae bacterium]NIS84784.1 HlyD family efflux transporter periplasmic adaptor subunit [Nitrospinaceae bacterium]NIT81585.1 HlyD family efflux transporter periplasmic adaptor subunit [Nitrospinaceae bacterium]NIU43869.1 HlyD family efflux transporter periplasmic adaptor subunit [Nitrospinaceae bacterium]
MKPSKKTIILALLLIAGGGVYFHYFHPKKTEPPENAIRISGNIEVTDAQLGFKIPGLVVERLVDEGEEVQKGQLVARLENTDLVSEVELRQSEVNAARATLDELLAGSRPEEIKEAQAAVEHTRTHVEEMLAGSRPQEIATARAAVERSRAEMENFKLEYERQKKLFEQGVASEEVFKSAKTNLDVATARLREAKEQLKLKQEGPRKEEIQRAKADLSQAKERLALIRKGPRQEVINQARAKLQQTQAALKLAQTRLSYATLVSPMAGVVLSKNIEPGEFVSPGTPVVTIGDIRNVWLRGYINQTDLGRVKLGQQASLYVDTYP